MDDGALWGACDPQPIQQVGMFSGPDNQGTLLCHAEPSYPQYWGSETWPPPRTDDISDISLMSPSLVDPSMLGFDHPVLNPLVAGDAVHDLGAGNSRFPQHGQWGQNLGSGVLYPAQDVQEILGPFMQFNSPALALPHLPQDNFHFNNKSFGTITSIHNNRPGTSSNAPTTQYGGSSMVSNNRAVNSLNASTTQYGSSPIIPNSMGMFTSTVPRGIVNTSGMGGGMNSNIGLMHLPKRLHSPSLAPKAVGDVTAADAGSGSCISSVPGASTFSANQSSGVSVLMPLADSSHMHKIDTTPEEPKMASFNPGPYVSNARVVPAPKQQHDQQDALASNRMWVENSLGKSSAVPIPNMGHRQQQGMSNTSPVTSLGFDHRHQQAMSNSSPVTNMGFEPRRQQAMSSSSPITNFGSKPPMGSSPIPIMGFEHRHQHQRMPSSSPIPILGFEQRQQQSISNSSSSPNLGFEQMQQPTTSTSPPLSTLSYEPRQPHQQQSVSNAAPGSSLVFEPRRQQQSNLTSNASSIPNLARQQPSASNPRSAIPDSAESAPNWPVLRMGAGPGLSSNEKAPMMMQQPETGTLKCALPRSNSASTSPAVNSSPANKRPLFVITLHHILFFCSCIGYMCYVLYG